jgi:hypothetical protein
MQIRMVVFVGIVAAALSLYTSLMFFGLHPVTLAGWVLSALVGLPAYIVVEAIGSSLSSAPPPRLAADEKYSTKDIDPVIPKGVRVARGAIVMAGTLVAALLLAGLLYGFDGIVARLPWLGTQFG